VDYLTKTEQKTENSKEEESYLANTPHLLVLNLQMRGETSSRINKKSLVALIKALRMADLVISCGMLASAY